MLYKVVYNSKSCKLEIDENNDYDSLIEAIQGLQFTTSLPQSDRLQLLVGYPPILLIANGNDKININSGSIITIRDGDSRSISISMIKEKEILLSLIKKNIVINNILTKGYHRDVIEKALDISNDDEQLAESICNDMSNNSNSNNTSTITRVIIDADNSCLFNAIGYCTCNSKKLGTKLRQLIVDEINKNEEDYTDDILGKPRHDYCQWISNPEKWGGELEMLMLSKILGVSINAIDVETNNVYKYENFNSDKAIYVIYDGIHYDSIALSSSSSSSSNNDNDNITIFDKNDNNTLNLIKQLALELKKQRQFVNLTSQKFEMKCMVCSILLKGQNEAVEHANLTGHQNFAQA